MQALTQARLELEKGVTAVEAPLITLHTRGKQLTAQARTITGGLDKSLSAIELKAKALEATLVREQTQTHQLVEALAGVKRSAAQTAEDAIVLQGKTESRAIGTASQAAKTVLDQAQAQIKTATDEVEQLLNTIDTTRTEVRAKVDQGLELLKSAEQKLDALRDTLMDTLKQTQDTVVGALKQVQQAANQFISQIRGVVRQFADTINSATAPVIAGAAELQKLVTDITTKAEELIAQIENIVATAIGIIDKIPVSALPEPMAKPAVTALTQAATQFGTQLQAGAKVASTQLGTVSKQISTAIEQGQTTLSEQLDAALKPLFEQIDKVLDQIEQKKTEIEQQISTQVDAVIKKKDELIASAKTQIAAVVDPALAQLKTLREQVEQVANQAGTTLETAMNTASETLGQVKVKVSDAEAELAGVEKKIGVLDTQLKTEFSKLREGLELHA